MKLKRTLSLLLAAMLLVSLLAACGGTPANPDSDKEPEVQNPVSDAADPAAPEGGKRVDTVTVAMASAAETLHPYYITGNYGDVIFDMIFDRFYDYKGTGEITPRLAESHESTVNEDGTMSITFHLNPNAKWHDGEPLTAHDVVFTAQLITNPAITTNRRTYWASLAGTDDSGACADPSQLGVTADDDYTVTYQLKQVVAVDAYIYIEARFQYVLPEHLLKDKDPATIHQDAYFQNPVGSGPLKFDSQVAGETVELVANMDYFRGAPNMDRLIIKTMEATNFVSALMSGEIDCVVGNGLGDIPLDDWDYICSQDNIQTSSTSRWGYQYMTINWARDYFQDARVRQAISMAINRQAIVDQLLLGQGIISVSSVTPRSPYFNTAIQEDPYDPERARELLEEAGWDFDRVLDYCVPIGNKTRENAAVLIQQDLAAVGIKTEIRMVDFATEVVELREGKTDFGMLGGGGSVDPDDVRINFNSEGANNFSMLPDQTFYNMLDEARCAQSVEERKALYDQWQQACYDETPYVWLYHENQLVAYSDIFENYPCDDFNMINWRVLEWTFR